MVSDWTHLYELQKHKPGTLAKILKHNKPKDRKYGKKRIKCIFCGAHERIIRRYGLWVCGRCFREKAKELGFEVIGE